MTICTALDRVDGDAVERLLDRAFGADRRQRTAYRLREGAAPIAPLSLAMVDGDTLVGTIQCWPVAWHGDAGGSRPLVLVGPVAVLPERQGAGIGRALMTDALAAATAHGLDAAMMLIGDPEYYGRFFGFDASHTARWRLPGPVERHRLLARGPEVPDAPGRIGPRVSVAA